MKKRKKWVAVEDYEDLVAEVAHYKSIHESMCFTINELVLRGNAMYDLALADSTGLWTSKEFQQWKDVIEEFK